MNSSAQYLSRILLATGLVFAFGAAQAAPITFDFGAIGVSNEGGNPGENDATPVGLRFDGSNAVFTDGFSGSGLQVIATGQNQGSASDPFAYLDDLFQGRQAGLGVCQNLAGTDCTPSSDDNITGSSPGNHEQLTLTFNSLVELSGLTFKGENHFGVDALSSTGSPELDGTDTFFLNGASTTFADAEGGLLSLIGSEFTFGFGGDVPEQFYLGALSAEARDVPAPAAIGLLGFGLVGLGTAIRRRRHIG